MNILEQTLTVTNGTLVSSIAVMPPSKGAYGATYAPMTITRNGMFVVEFDGVRHQISCNLAKGASREVMYSWGDQDAFAYIRRDAAYGYSMNRALGPQAQELRRQVGL